MSGEDIARQPITDRRSSYIKWVEAEGIPLIQGFFIADVKTVPLGRWERIGGQAARICLEGTGETDDAYICEIPPGASLKPQKHFFEELIYVVKGRGATTVWQEGGPKRSFEWQEGALFSPPFNAWHQHFNGSGSEPARFLGVTSAPIMINLIHNIDFIFGCAYVFQDRFDSSEDYFSGQGRWLPGIVWETNFVADARSFQLLDRSERGAGGQLSHFELSNNTMCAHISQFPVGTYKKAHRHGPGAHVLVLSGRGYSLMWREGEPMQRFDWGPGSLVVPPDRWFHQHFNAGSEPARYLALRWGGKKFFGTMGEGDDRPLKDIKLGGDQIEYEDEDPAVRRMFEEALAKAGIQSRMAAVYKKQLKT
ncbi:MAG TPA: cupin domain-containing protein [Candidatus Binatia bacterium]|jgi:mannose-6-phosphate isomerase-like protein (cupin superfamily)